MASTDDITCSVSHLSRVRLRPSVRKIFILTKIYDADLVPKTRDLTKWLLSPERDREYTIYVEDRLQRHRLFDSDGLVGELNNEYALAERPRSSSMLAGGATAGSSKAQSGVAVSGRLLAWNAEACRKATSTATATGAGSSCGGGLGGDNGSDFDLIITLGGDGTVLYASWLFQGEVPPVISFCLGSLGFLTKFDFGDFRAVLSTALASGVTVSRRRRFQGVIMRSRSRRHSGDPAVSADEAAELEAGRDLVEELIGEAKGNDATHVEDRKFEILNEIVVDRGPNPTLSYMEVFGDDEHFTSVLADGICVSTPTGSTAYNLAAGGSLCHPANPVMLVTSICAHTLSFRPIILPDAIRLRVGVPYDTRHGSWASFDGRERVELRPGDYVAIRAGRFPFPCVQAEGRAGEDWVNSISGKLGWNTRHPQKEYQDWIEH